MRLTFPVQILLFVLVFMVLSWLAMHVHVSNSLASPLKKSEPAIGDVGETSLALQQAGDDAGFGPRIKQGYR